MDWDSTLPPDWVNPRLGIRFDEDGRFLPEAGNTVVCQVIPGSPTEAALQRFQTALATLPEAGLFAFTPVASWHMTVFEGVVDSRRHPDHWPEGLDPAAPLDQVTAAMTDRLDGFTPPPPPRMAIAAATPFGLSLRGATPEDEARARLWRDRLATAFGLHRPSHATYAFHTTLAYLKRAPSGPSRPLWRALLADWTTRLQTEIPFMDLAPPAFCTFADMRAFPPRRALTSAPNGGVNPALQQTAPRRAGVSPPPRKTKRPAKGGPCIP